MRRWHILSSALVLGFLVAVLSTPPTAAPEGAAASAWRLSPEIRIPQPTSPECSREYPSVAYNWVQHEYLVVWYNWWSLTFHDIYARRVTSTGKLETWFCVASGAGGDNRMRWHPAVAYNAAAGEYLVVYMYDASGDAVHWEVWGRRVAWNGSYMGPEFQIFTWPNRAFWYPRVAWNSYRNEYLVVANALDTTTGLYNDVAGRRVMADGSTPYPGHNISSQSQTTQPHQADVTYNLAADEYLVVWRRRFSGYDWDIWGARVRGDNGNVVPPGEFLINGASADQDYPAVATNEQDRYLVVWQHGVGLPATDWDIHGVELDITGTCVPPEIEFAHTAEREEYPAVAINAAANERFVVWRQTTASGPEIRGGVLRGPPPWMYIPFSIAFNTPFNPPGLAAGPPGYLIVYGRVESSVLYVYGRLWWPEALYLPLVVRNFP